MNKEKFLLNVFENNVDQTYEILELFYNVFKEEDIDVEDLEFEFSDIYNDLDVWVELVEVYLRYFVDLGELDEEIFYGIGYYPTEKDSIKYEDTLDNTIIKKLDTFNANHILKIKY